VPLFDMLSDGDGVVDDDDEDDELGEDMLPDVPAVPVAVDELELVSVDGVEDDDEDVDGAVEGLIVELELELLGGIVLGAVVVVVVELVLDDGGVAGTVVVVDVSLLHPTTPTAAAMASTAQGLAFMRDPPKRCEGTVAAKLGLAGSVP